MEDNFNKHLGNKLKLRRLALGLTQTKVAKAINVTFQQIAISITGVAGPGGTTTKPEGMVCFSIAFDNKAKLIETKNFGPLGRNIVRQKATLYGLTLLENALAQ